MDNFNLITKEIIGKAFIVSNLLGNGFLEKVYENALAYELRKCGYLVLQQHPVEVFYKDQSVGSYFADLVVENIVLVELKTVKELNDIHMAQILHYLKACRYRIGLLINFGNPEVEVKRVINGY